MPNRKLIGVTGPSLFTDNVIHMVEEYFGANPILLYMDNKQNLDQWVDQVDAIFLCGGVDLHPMTYGRSYPARRNMKTFDLRRDRREIHLIDRAIAKRVPMLGICRGHQLLGSYLKKFTMVADLCEDSTIVHCPSLQEPKFATEPYEPIHIVEVLVGRKLFGKDDLEDMWVNSFHHQGLLYCEEAEKDPDVIGTSVVTDKKNIVELIDCPAQQWMSCQWHPEYDYREQDSSMRLLTYFKEKYLKAG